MRLLLGRNESIGIQSLAFSCLYDISLVMWFKCVIVQGRRCNASPKKHPLQRWASYIGRTSFNNDLKYQ